MTLFIFAPIALLGIATLWIAWMFNTLVSLRNRMRGSWSDIDALLKRRADLIPNIVAAVAGYTEHEKRTLDGVTAARASAVFAGGSAERPATRAAAEDLVTARLGQLFAVVENYPDLKADEAFLELQHELVDTEDDIAKARRYYNAVVRDYNTLREKFPNSLVAGSFRFHPGAFFELANLDERDRPDVGIRS